MVEAKLVLCQVLDTDARGRRRILLGRKKRGFGTGRIIGPGGHVEAGETLARAAAREVAEETGLVVDPADLDHVAHLDFRFPHRPEWSTVVAALSTTRFSGDLRGSDELDAAWYDVDHLPLEDMWDDDRYWLPQVLSGRRVSGVFVYGPDNATVAEARLTDLAPPEPSA